MELTTDSAEETQKLGRHIGQLAVPGDVFLLTGNLGSGKTCLTQGIAWGLGVEGYAMSPSFVIVRELHGRLPLYHIDLYRLDRVEESADLGLDEYFYGSGVSVVEWAEKALGLMPPEHLLIEIAYLSDTGRRLKLKPNGQRYQDIVEQLSGFAD
jgi:tRNA threonylcarbamoyladenosine biosynthesis protein TsaE